MASDDKTQIAGTATASKVEPGTRILGTFEIQDLIATGGMGEVYRGFNIHTNQSVAIKIVLAALAHDEKIISLFQKEATVLGELHHDAIVRYNIFTIDPVIQRACLVMEFVEGRSMADFYEEGAMSIEDVKILLTRLAGGLQKAHDLGVVHRDLSPDNVIIQDGMVTHAKIIDFGIAKSANFGGGTLLDGQFAGKYNYVSPEQLGRFKGVVTGRSDIYSLALVAVAGCRGEPLDMGDNPAEAVERRMHVPDLSGVYDELRPLLEMMLQPDPADRPESMAQVLEFLQNPALIPSNAALAEPEPQISQPPQPQVSQPPGAVTAPPAYGFTSPPQSTPPGTYPPDAVPPPQSTTSPFGGAAASRQVTGPGTTLPPVGGTYPGTVAPQMPAPEPKKSKTGLIVALLAVVIGGGGAGAYFSGALDSVISGETAEERAARLETERLIAEADARVTEQDLMAAFRGAGALGSEDLGSVTALSEAARTKLLESLGLSGDTTDLAGLQEAIKGKVEAETAQAEAAATQAQTDLVDALKNNGSFGTGEEGLFAGLTPLAREKLLSDLGLDAGSDLAAVEEFLKRRLDLEQRLATAEADKALEALFGSLREDGELSATDLENTLALAPESLAKLLGDLGLPEGAPDLAGLNTAAVQKFLDDGNTLPNQSTDVDPPQVDVATDAGQEVSPSESAATNLAGIGDRIEWVEAYPLDSCTHVQVTSASDTSVNLEGFGTSVDPFWDLLKDFDGQFGAEPEIGVRLVKSSQCAVVDFAKRNAKSGAKPIELTLDKTVLESGGSIRGAIKDIDGRSIWLFLVDDNGSGYNLTSRLSDRDDGSQGFGMRLRTKPRDPGTLVPQLVLAVATDKPLQTAEAPAGVISAQLMPIMQAEINDLETPPAVALGYFRFDTDN